MGNSWRGDFTIRLRELKGLSMFLLPLTPNQKYINKANKAFQKKENDLISAGQSSICRKALYQEPNSRSTGG